MSIPVNIDFIIESTGKINTRQKTQSRKNRTQMTLITRINADKEIRENPCAIKSREKKEQNVFNFTLLFYAFRLEAELLLCTFYFI